MKTIRTKTKTIVETKIETKILVLFGVAFVSLAALTMAAGIVILPGTSKSTPMSLDLNGDRIINALDVDVLISVIFGYQSCPQGKRCDVNGDGKVDAGDISRFALEVGKKGYLPIYISQIDFNYDKIIDTDDTTALLRVALGLNECPTGFTCDLNGDNIVDISDVIIIQRIALGLEPTSRY